MARAVKKFLREASPSNGAPRRETPLQGRRSPTFARVTLHNLHVVVTTQPEQLEPNFHSGSKNGLSSLVINNFQLTAEACPGNSASRLSEEKKTLRIFRDCFLLPKLKEH